MKWRFLMAASVLIAAIACNTDATVQDQRDTSIRATDSTQGHFPKPGHVLGGDTMSSPNQSNQPAVQQR